MTEERQLENEIAPITKVIEENLPQKTFELNNLRTKEPKTATNPLVKTYNKMLHLDDNLQNKQEISKQKFQDEFQLNYTVTATEQKIASVNEAYKEEIYCDINVIDEISKDYDEKETALSKLENEINDLNAKRLQQMADFSRNISKLAVEYENLDSNINVEKFEREIADLNEKRSLIMSKVLITKKEIEDVKCLMKESKIDTMINVADISKILREESGRLFGNANYNKRILRDLSSQISVLKRKIQELD